MEQFLRACDFFLDLTIYVLTGEKRGMHDGESNC